MLHPAGAIYGFVFIKDKLKFEAHEAQMTPPASLLKMSLILSVWLSVGSISQVLITLPRLFP